MTTVATTFPETTVQEENSAPMGRLLSMPYAPMDPYKRLTLPSRLVEAQKKEGEEPSLGETALPTPDTNERSDSQQTVLDKGELRAYMISHSLQGNKMSKSRTPFIGEVVSMVSPSDPEVTFGIKRLNNRAVMTYRDANAQVRYVIDDGSEKMTTEKEYPMGTMLVQVVSLGLDNWNITDAANNPVNISEDAILTYLDPEELDAIYDKVMEVNPILTGAARKNS